MRTLGEVDGALGKGVLRESYPSLAVGPMIGFDAGCLYRSTAVQGVRRVLLFAYGHYPGFKDPAFRLMPDSWNSWTHR